MPASLSNLGPGFDVLGLALRTPAERLVARRAESVEVVYDPSVVPFVPDDPRRDLARLGADEVLAALGRPGGVALEIRKAWPPGSGMGSSAASAVGAVVAVDALYGGELSDDELLACAGRAELRGTGSVALDNCAASLRGGLVAITGQAPPRAVSLMAPPWPLALVLPEVVVRTEEARAVVPEQVPLDAALANLRDVAGLLAAIERNDLQGFADHLVDHLVSPARRPLLAVPGPRDPRRSGGWCPGARRQRLGPRRLRPLPRRGHGGAGRRSRHRGHRRAWVGHRRRHLWSPCPVKLVLLRHAKSSWKHALPDHERPLSGRGKRDAPVVGERIAEAGFAPDLVISSDSRRTRQTWARMRELLGDPPATWRNDFYLGSPTTVLRALAELSGPETVLVLGHNPGWEDLLAGFGYPARFTTCNAALLESASEDWASAVRGPWSLVELIRPRPPRG